MNTSKPVLSLGLLALGLKFFQEVFHVIPIVFTMSESDVILVLLSLIDMALVGGLLVMVMISGYENFVQVAHGKRRHHEGHVNDHVPFQVLGIDVLGVHEDPQQMDRRNRHDGRRDLHLQRRGVNRCRTDQFSRRFLGFGCGWYTRRHF